MKSRARCVPLQYLLSAPRGVKTASINETSKQNRIVVSTPLQEESWTHQLPSNQPSLTSACQVSTQSIQSESAMFYGPSKKKMECEKYQDCSWFRREPSTLDSINKSSLAESPFADTETNEFGFHMQIEDKDNPRWGDEYLEVFDDDMQLELNDKMGDPNKSNISPSNENYSTINFKMGEDSVYEKYDFNDYLIKKTDSFDNMKDISSTDPAKVVPISHHERLNHSNYGIAFDIKSEVKEEVELYSPGSDTYVLESDDSDLNIGREETIEVEEISISIQDAREKSQKMEEKPVVFDTKTAPTIDLVRELKKPLYDLSDVLKETANDVYPMPVLQGDNFNQSFKQPKPGLNLELEKISLEPVNMNTPATPDLDFMDLVNFIISDLNPPTASTLPTTPAEEIPTPPKPPKPEKAVTIKKEGQKKNMKETYLAIPRQVTSNSPDDQKLPKMVILKTASNELSTINMNDLCDSSVSIAERIKTGSKRRRPARYEVKEEPNDADSSDDEDGDDDYEEELPTKKKYSQPRKRSRSSTMSSESSCSSRRHRDDSSVVGVGDRYRELRDKNNEASRKSRQNRKDKERDMFRSLEDTEKRNVQLKARAEELEKLVTSLRQLLLQVVLKKGGAT